MNLLLDHAVNVREIYEGSHGKHSPFLLADTHLLCA